MGCGTVPNYDAFAVYSGCDSSGLSKDAYRQCGQQLMLRDLYRGLRYPDTSRRPSRRPQPRIKTRGTAVVTFTIDTLGYIHDATIVRDPFPGAGDEALRLVKQLGRFDPAVLQGKRVPVTYNLPVRFPPKPEWFVDASKETEK